MSNDRSERRPSQTRREMIQKSLAGIPAAAAAIGLRPSHVRSAAIRPAGHAVAIALVGGQHSHAPDFASRMAANAGIVTKYVWDSDAATAHRRQAVTGGVVVADVGPVLADPEVRAVIICSQTVRHVDLVPPAVAAGKHVFVEKPLGMNGEESVRLAAAIKQAGVLFQTGFVMRSEPAYLFVRDLIRNGALGTLTRMRISICHGGALYGWFDGEFRWMADAELAGVGGFGDLGAHAADLLIWLMKDDTPVLATGQIGTVTGRYAGIDEFGEGMVRFRSGLVATIAAGWVDVANPNVLEVAGTEGHLRVTDGHLYIRSDNLEGADGRTPWTDLPDRLAHPFDLFLDAIRGRDAPLIPVEDAALGNRLISAVYRGAKRETWVRI